MTGNISDCRLLRGVLLQEALSLFFTPLGIYLLHQQDILIQPFCKKMPQQCHIVNNVWADSENKLIITYCPNSWLKIFMYSHGL